MSFTSLLSYCLRYTKKRTKLDLKFDAVITDTCISIKSHDQSASVTVFGQKNHATEFPC